MIVIKGWTNHKSFYVSCKIRDNLSLHEAWMLKETAKLGERIGRISLTTRNERFEYIRLDNGRIVIRQI